MALTVNQQLKYWSVAAIVLFASLWFLSGVILPFILGGAIAYVLDPLADRLQKWGLGRTLSAVLIMLVALLIFAVLLVAVVPLLIDQGTRLVLAAPGYFESIRGWLSERFPSLMSGDSIAAERVDQITSVLQERGGQLISSLFASVSGLLNVAVLAVLVPVITFYLLLDWDDMVARIDTLLPRDHRATIRAIARDVDRTLASFIRGQGTVCLILGTYYAVALMLVGLNFGLVVGAIAGFLTFIPYVGALVGGGLAVGLALFQFWGDWWWIILVAAIFQSGQFVEGNFLTPKLVGTSVGLHPVWLIFALSAFGALFGFVGLLVAVPVAAVIGVFARFGLERYRESALYQGTEGPPDEGS